MGGGDQGRYSSQGNSSRQPPQQQRGRGRGFISSSSPGYSDTAVQGNRGQGSSVAIRRGGVNTRGRGRGQRGRGRGSNSFFSGHSDNYSEYKDFGTEPHHTYSNNTVSMGRGGRQFSGHGRGAFSTGYNTGARSHHQPNRPWSSSTGPSHMPGVSQPPVSPLTSNADPPHLPFQLSQRQSPAPLFGAPPITPPVVPPPLPPPSAPPISSPLHLVPHSPLQRFPSYPPSQSSPTSPWAPPTQPLPPQQQHHGHGLDGEQFSSHPYHQPPSYQQRQPVQYGHQQQQLHGGSGSGEDYSIAGVSAGQAQSSGTPGQASDVIKTLVSNGHS